MQTIVLLIGAAIALVGLFGVVTPALFRRMLGSWDSEPRFLFAIIFRLLMGTVLLLAADELRFSLVMKILGWLTIAAALGIPVLGRDRLDQLLNWWLSRSDGLLRLSTALVIVFGGFLIYVSR